MQVERVIKDIDECGVLFNEEVNEHIGIFVREDICANLRIGGRIRMFVRDYLPYPINIEVEHDGRWIPLDGMR